MSADLRSRRRSRSGTVTPAAPMPAPPVRSFSFTDFSTNNPTTPQPGNQLDSNYDQTNASVASVITWASVSLNTDGTIRDATIGSNQLVSGLFDDVAQDIIDEVQPLVDEAQGYASGAAGSSTTAQAAATSASSSNLAAQAAAGSATASASSASTSVSTAQAAATAASNAASNATNAANDADGDLALCTDYGLVTQAWAEHMPDTIPPNILAVMGVSGSHWSSRWWASQAAATVALLYGALNYRGAWNPVTNTPVLASGGLSGGVPSKVGDYYVASVTGTSVAIDGSTTWSAGDLIVSNGTVWQRIQSAGGAFLPLVGGTMLGPITLSGSAAQPMQAVPLQQVDTLNVVNVLNHGAKGDGVTDDTAAIQAVLNTYAGKAAVFVPDTGHVYVTGGLVVPTGTDLLLHGTLQSRTNGGTVLNIINGTHNVTVRGHGTIDCNGTHQTGPQAGVYLYQANNVQVLGITVKNSFQWNANVVQSSFVLFDGVSLIGGTASNEFVGPNATNCWIVNSYISGVSNDGSFTFYGGVRNSGMVGCMVTGGFVSGVGVYSDTAAPGNNTNITIADNIFTNNTRYGINVSVGTGGVGLHDGIIISNNRCNNNGRGGLSTPQFADIWIDSATNVTVIGNQSSNFGGGTAPEYGLYSGPNASGVSFIGNHVYNTGQGGTVGVGLQINSTNYLVANGNYFYDNQGTPTMATAIGGNAGQHNAYIGNFCDRPVTLIGQPDSVGANMVTGRWMVGFGNAANDVNSVINAKAGQHASLEYYSGGSLRWYAGTDAAAETGGNAGSNFAITSCADTGGALLTALAIDRPTSLITFGNQIAFRSSRLPANAANDAAAATAGIQIGGVYRNGSVMMVRTV